jgi:hypothetical protein
MKTGDNYVEYVYKRQEKWLKIVDRRQVVNSSGVFDIIWPC